MPSDDERGLPSGSRSTETASRGLPAQVAGQASRRRREYPLVGPEEASEARAAARRLQAATADRKGGATGPAGDGFRYVARHDLAAPSVSRGPDLTEQQANDFLSLVRTPVTHNEDLLRPARAEAARHGRSSREKLSAIASQFELFAYMWRLRYLNSRPPMPDEDPAAQRPLDDPGETSLAGALRALKANTVGAARAQGLPLAASWADELSLSDPTVTTTVIYVGPGFAGLFDTAGKLKPSPFGWIWRVSAAPKLEAYSLGDFCTGGIFFSIKVNLGARGIQEWVLPLSPAGRAFRVGDFGIDLVELTSSQRRTLREWNLKQNRGMVFVLSPSYWDRKSIGAAVTEAPHRLWAAALRCVEAGYLWAALGEQLSEIGPAQVARIIFEMLLARLGVPTPDGLDGAGRLGRAIGMAVWGDTNEDADVDAAARLLAPEAASMIIGAVVQKGARKAAGAAIRQWKGKGDGDSQASPPQQAGEPAAPAETSPPAAPARADRPAGESPRDVRTAGARAGEGEGTAGTGGKPGAGEQGVGEQVEGSRPNDRSRGLADEPRAAAQRTRPSSAPAGLQEALALLRRNRLFVPAAAILKGAIEYGRARIKVLSEWFEGTVYYYKRLYYVAIDGVNNQLVKIGRRLEEWDAWANEGPKGALYMAQFVESAAKIIYKAVRARLTRGITPKEAGYLEQLDAASWDRVMRYARGNQKIDSIKGKLAEELIKLTPKFQAAMERARQAAAQEGFATDTVRFIPNMRGRTLSEAGRWGTGELTDGVIAAVEYLKPGDPPIVRIYAVFESKSPSNARDLAHGRGGGIGQVGKDVERFSELPSEVDGIRVPPENVAISRHHSEWLVMTPPGTKLTRVQLEWLEAGFPNVRAFHTPIRNHVLREVAAELAALVRSGELPLVTGQGGKGPSLNPYARPEPAAGMRKRSDPPPSPTRSARSVAIVLRHSG